MGRAIARLLAYADCRLRSGFWSSLGARSIGIHFIARILRFEEVHELEDVGSGAHPLCRVGCAIMLFESELFESSVSYILHILVNIVRIEAEDSIREQILVIRDFLLDAFDDDISNLIGKFYSEEILVFFQNILDEVDAELEVEAFVSEHP